MTLGPALTAIARGDRPDDDALLGNCRLEWAGAEAYGEEAILESFRRSPLDLDSGTLVACAGAALWMSGEAALVADLYDRRVGRLWRLGPGVAPPPEPALWVPFETDLSQTRASLMWRPEDHPWLEASDVERAAVLAKRLITPGADYHRIRGFVLRAFSAEGHLALLLSRYTLGAGDTRASTSGLVAALAGPSGERLTQDQEPRPQWVMRL